MRLSIEGLGAAKEARGSVSCLLQEQVQVTTDFEEATTTTIECHETTKRIRARGERYLDYYLHGVIEG